MPKHPVAIIILDGLGYRKESADNAVAQANTPYLDSLMKAFPNNLMQASGEAVGLPKGLIGNSEVGHTNIGAGRVVYQSVTRINRAIELGQFSKNQALLDTFDYVKENNKPLHLFGLVSDGGVHSSINHLFAILQAAKDNDVSEIYVHVFTDGRDVAPDSGIDHIKNLQRQMEAIGVGEIATVTGRYYSMDRDKRFEREKIAYDAIFNGIGHKEVDPVAGVEKSYLNGVFDEFIEPIVIEKDNQALATVQDGDAVLFFNFRADRVRQLAHLTTENDFAPFEKGNNPKDLYVTSMMDYGDGIQTNVMFSPENIVMPIGEVVSNNGMTQFRIAETEKYPHVTYFMNGGREEPFEGEVRKIVPSPHVSTYDLMPEMNAHGVADELTAAIQSKAYDLFIANFANPDMVGHSGKIEPTIKAIETVDECLKQVMEALFAENGEAIIFADHGNSELLKDENGDPHTAHTTNLVPVIVTKKGVSVRDNTALCDIAPTALDLLGILKPEEMTGQSIIIE